MRLVILSVLSLTLISGCGWKMIKAPINVQGQVLESQTHDPIEGAYIDIADDREKLELALKTDTLTDKNGIFNATYDYMYEKWMWLAIPVHWFPKTPERIYVEVTKDGYRSRTVEQEYSANQTGPLQLDPIYIQLIKPKKKTRKNENPFGSVR